MWPRPHPAGPRRPGSPGSPGVPGPGQLHGSRLARWGV
jgi:hypothetical protein